MLNTDFSGSGDSSLIEACRRKAESVLTVDAFKAWTRAFVRPVLPHGALSCVHGSIYSAGVSLDYVVTVDFPLSHLEAIRNSSGHMDTPLAHIWYEQQVPVFFDADNPPASSPASWLASFRKHGLRNCAAHGVLDEARCIATYFSFNQLPTLDEPVLRRTFQALIPLMHETFMRVIRNHSESLASSAFNCKALTLRERQIVMHIGQGKSNPEIAQLLHLSENTVRNQVSRILEKTGCSNRTALATAALQQQEGGGIGTKIL